MLKPNYPAVEIIQGLKFAGAIGLLAAIELAVHVETGADLQYYVPSLNVSTALTLNDYVYVIRGMGPTAGLPTVTSTPGRDTAHLVQRFAGANT